MPSLPGSRFGPHAIAAALGLGLGFLPASAQAQGGKAEPRTISVSGTGKVSARPDVASALLRVSLISRARSAAASARRASRTSAARRRASAIFASISLVASWKRAMDSS